MLSTDHIITIIIILYSPEFATPVYVFIPVNPVERMRAVAKYPLPLRYLAHVALEADSHLNPHTQTILCTWSPIILSALLTDVSILLLSE
jgi:hypothetical protein